MTALRADDEQRLRQILADNPYFGDWDEWAAIAYDKIPVLPRAALEHLYGRHDDTELPYADCVLCSLLRVTPAPSEERCHATAQASTWLGGRIERCAGDLGHPGDHCTNDGSSYWSSE